MRILKFLKFASIFAFMMLLTACMGGGSNTPTTPNNPNNSNAGANSGNSNVDNSHQNISNDGISGGSNADSDTNSGVSNENTNIGSSGSINAGNGILDEQNTIQPLPLPQRASMENIPKSGGGFDDSNSYLKISVIDTDYADPNDSNAVGSAYKDTNGNNRLILNDGYLATANGTRSDHGAIVSAIVAKYNKTSMIYAYTAKAKFGSTVEISNVVLEAAYKSGARIFNNSWGNTREGFSQSEYSNKKTWQDRIGNPIDAFIAQKAASDSIFIFAAGNEKQEYATTQSHLPVVYDNARKGFIVVTAISGNQKAYYANKLGTLAQYWGIASYGSQSVFDDSKSGSIGGDGTSFSAPVVSAAVANVWQKYPWMSNHLVTQTILSTADQLGTNIVTTGPNENVGWGVLNEQRALNGPARFDKRLLTNDEPDFVVADFSARNYTDLSKLTFSNDITGDAGFKKKGTGTLYFSGVNNYEGNTIIENGRLVVQNKLLKSNVEIKEQGIFQVKNENTSVELGSDFTNTGAQNYTLTNNGTLEVYGRGGVVLHGDYNATQNARTIIDIYRSVFDIRGNADFGNSRIVADIENVSEVPSNIKHTKTIVKTQNLQNFDGYYTISSRIYNYVNVEDIAKNGNNIEATFSRNSTAYVLSGVPMSESMTHSAQNLDLVLEEVATNKNHALNAPALAIINASTLGVAQTTQTLSAEIYASGQNTLLNNNYLLHKNVLSHSKINNDGVDVWLEIGYNRHKIAINGDGFASSISNSYLTQIGLGKNFGNQSIGLSAFHAQSDLSFDMLAGNQKIYQDGLTAYARHNWDSFYIMLDILASYTRFDTNRPLVIGDSSKSISTHHKASVYGIYSEIGHGHKYFSPFAGYLLNYFQISAIDERENLGINAAKHTNAINSYLAGFRVNFELDKLTFGLNYTYLYTPNGSFDFKANYNGSSTQVLIRGIQASKHQNIADIILTYPFSRYFTMQLSSMFSYSPDTQGQNINIGAHYQF